MAEPERQPPRDRQLELVEAAVRRAYADETDIRAALVVDMQGIGSGADVMSGPPHPAPTPVRMLRHPQAETAGARQD